MSRLGANNLGYDESGEATPIGDGLHWEVLDADFTVSGLLAGVFGSKRWMAELQQRWQRLDS